jgi:nucleotide-binding universal stress UspA family protein
VADEEHVSRGVVVGIDGSHRDEAAVSWGVFIASARQTGITLATGWSNEPDFEKIHREHADEWIDAARTMAQKADPTVSVDVVNRAEPALEMLVALSERADLIVVGSGKRGHPRWHELIDGSVGHRVATHAKCPVLIAKAP